MSLRRCEAEGALPTDAALSVRQAILKILFVAWVILWAVFFARELFIKKNIRDYQALLSRTLEGKHAYVTGEKLYGFLSKCSNVMPVNSTYRFEGIEEGALERRRAVYYLYPNNESSNPDFIIDMAHFTIKKAKE
jgi:hypothetical protein